MYYYCPLFDQSSKMSSFLVNTTEQDPSIHTCPNCCADEETKPRMEVSPPGPMSQIRQGAGLGLVPWCVQTAPVSLSNDFGSTVI